MTTLELLFYLAIFVTAVFVFDLVMNFAESLRLSRALAANKRTRMLADGATSAEVLSRFSRVKSAADGEKESSLLTRGLLWLDDSIRRGGMSMSPARFLWAVVAVGVALAALFWVALKLSPVGALLIGFIFAFVSGFMVLSVRIGRRQARMSEQLPDVVDMAVRSLQAGHPIRAALTLVSNDVEDPLGTEIGIAVDEMTFGLELEEALENLRQRVRVPDLDYMVVAINIHSRTGGNLAEILSNLSGVIRDRYRLFKKVRALSAEGRLSAYIIGVIPFIIALILGLNVKNYYQDAAQHPAFPIIALVALTLYAGALFAIYRIIRIKV